MLPEKARLLKGLRNAKFNVPDLIYVSAEDFKNENFAALETFLDRHREGFKVIARSAHPKEEYFKGGTFDSLEIYADLGGIKYARKKIINLANTAKQLSIRRQQKFSKAPDIDLENMGVIVMPFISGTSVMAKMLGNHWEFGYCRNRSHKVQREPYITRTPHFAVKLNMWFPKKEIFLLSRPKTFLTSKPLNLKEVNDQFVLMGCAGSERIIISGRDRYM